MNMIPHVSGFDNTAALLKEGYTFISNRCRQYHTDAFETRILLQQAVCVLGEDAARMFYTPGRFTRKFAMPPTALFLLQDIGSVALRDGSDHYWRKQMFMSLMAAERRLYLCDLLLEQLRLAREEWKNRSQVVFHQEAEILFFRAVCEWSGILPLDGEAEQRTAELSAMVDGAGAVGPRAWKGMLLRSRTEQWVRHLIEAVRDGKLEVPKDSAVYVISHHRDRNGQELDVKTAGVELINVLRATVAVARYITFSAVALETYPEWKEKLSSSSDNKLLDAFVLEVRRYYPFFPLVAGRALEAFYWREYHFTKGSWVILDLYGTNHDPRIWPEPYKFRPERFLDWEGNAYTLIPHGGGDYLTGHRCPGEPIAIDLMKAAIQFLVSEIEYDVPQQDLRIDLSRMPAIPESRFVIKNVRDKDGPPIYPLDQTEQQTSLLR